MKTYRTFSLCKLAHPDRDVYQDINCNLFAPKSNGESWIKRRPEDYLMSMEEFLNKGFKFEVGDIYLGSDNRAYQIDDASVVALMNEINEMDKNRYILKAKALESCTSHGIASIQSASGHIEPIEREPVEQVLRRLNTEIDRALQSTSLSNGMRECLKSVISQVDDELLIQEAYSLHCEFYGNDAADFCAFKDDVGGRSLWLHFAKKLQEQA